MTLISAANLILSSLTVIGQIVIALLAISLVSRQTRVLNFISKNALLFSFIVALIATLGSLFYSEIAKFEPCKLCWVQRIFMYPQVFLSAIALWIWKKDKLLTLAADNHIALSFMGAVVAGYHYLLQIGIGPDLPCAAVGYSVSCSQRFVMNFGYITIPMMAFTAFLLIFVFSIMAKLRKK